MIKLNLLFQSGTWKSLRRKVGGERPGQGRPYNPVKQEYKEDPQEYFRKANAKHCGRKFL